MQLKNIKEVNSCLICSNKNLVNIIDLGEHAISSRFPKLSEPDPPLAPLQLVKCNDSLNRDACGLLQSKYIIPGEEMYTNQYGYRSGLNATMANHLNSLAKEIMSLIQLNEGDVILDIGSNDATLLNSFNIPGIKKIGIDPTGDQFKQFYKENTNLITDYFSLENFKKVSNKRAKVITSIAMFYDLPNPMKFVQDIKQCLDENGIWISEQSYMPLMLERNSFDTICHEHLEYYSLKQIDWMAKKLRLKILDVKFNEINGGSFRFYISHLNSNNPVNEKAITDILNKEKELGFVTLKPFEEFKDRVEKIKSQLLVFLKEKKKTGKKIHIYGASTKGNTLLQYFGIGSDIIDAAAERNPEKFGRVTPKTRIPMISEEISRKEKPDYFLVLPWHFKDEFIKREKSYLDSGGKFIFPLPEFQVIGKEDLEYGE